MGARKEEHTAHWQLSQSQQLVSRFQGLSPAAKEGMGLESRRLPSLHVDLGLFGGHHPPLQAAQVGVEPTQHRPHPQSITVRPRIISQSQGWQCFLCLVSARDKSTQGCRCRCGFCVVCWGLAWGLVGPLILQPATNRSSAPPTPGSCREKREDQGLELRGPFADLGSDQSVEWEMANAAWQKARDAPWDYGSWAELLTLLEGQGDASQLKLAYEEVLLEFPFSADTW